MRELRLFLQQGRTSPRTAVAPRREAGFTLVELMVAMAVALIVILAACFALISAQFGYRTTNAASQLRDNTRFAVTLIGRLTQQVGYQDYTTSGSVTRITAYQMCGTSCVKPDVFGYNNATVSGTTALASPYTGLANDSRPKTGDTNVNNGSDILVLRFQGQNGSSGSTADGSVINCSGNSEAAITNDSLDTRAYSVFYVDVNGTANEPTLMCGYRDSGGSWQVEPLIAGVETFQVLYGVYQQPGTGTMVSPSVWKRADQMATGDWYKVKRMTIGLVVRSTPNASQDRTGSSTFYPLGQSLSSADDSGTALTVANTDGRLRQAVTFTVDLRNPLNVQ